MRRYALSAAAIAAFSLCAAPAMADHVSRGATFKFGPDCKSVQRATGQATVVVGTVLGGQNRRGRWGDGTYRDYRTFQACFASVDACQLWVARNAAHHPQAPGYGRCTPVYVGLTPPAPVRAYKVRAIRTRG